MATLKLKVAKSKRINPQTKQMGFAARVLTNGTADFDDIVKEAGHNTTMHKAELRMAFELCMDSVAEMLKRATSSTWVLSASSIQVVRAAGTRKPKT